MGGCSSSRPVVQLVGLEHADLGRVGPRVIGPKARRTRKTTVCKQNSALGQGYPRRLLKALVNFTSPSPPTASTNTTSK